MFLSSIMTQETSVFSISAETSEKIACEPKNRKNTKAFTSNLFKLEQQKRDLEQDETLTRAIELFNETPVRQNNFKATIVKVSTTDLEYNNKYVYYALAIVLGGMIGVFYVLIANAFVNRKNDIGI